MKSHAVPQEILSMEFKLFGNFMTLREFIYIAVGIAVAWVFYFLQNTGVLPGILAWPATILFGLGGILFGLVPYQDRTLEQWIANFILAIRKPTLRIWKKPGFEPITKEDKEIVSLKSHVIAPKTTNVGKHKKKIVTPQEKTSEEEIERKIEESLQSIENTINQVEGGLASVTRPVPIKPPVQPQAQPVPQQPTQVYKTKMKTIPVVEEENLNFIKPKIEKPEPKALSQQLTQAPEIIPVTTNKKIVELNDTNIQQYASAEQIPDLQSNPNTINIIVRENTGKTVEGVVSVIKNMEGSPIRAAVSNDFGQVINNNPLDNGKYKVTLTKEGLSFNEFNIELKGNNYPILDITAQ